VSLDIVVDDRGRVKAVTVLDSDNHALADAARDAVRQWRFVPDQKAEIRANRHARVTISFELDEPA
jgi:TonB family protein